MRNVFAFCSPKLKLSPLRMLLQPVCVCTRRGPSQATRGTLWHIAEGKSFPRVAELGSKERCHDLCDGSGLFQAAPQKLQSPGIHSLPVLPTPHAGSLQDIRIRQFVAQLREQRMARTCGYRRRCPSVFVSPTTGHEVTDVPQVRIPLPPPS